MATFTWNVDTNATLTKKPRVTNIKFGDGYEQRVSYGLNTILQEWDLSFSNREESESNEIDSFLEARGGYESFDWTPPGESSSRKFKCQEWSKVAQKGGFYSISAKFEEVAGV